MKHSPNSQEEEKEKGKKKKARNSEGLDHLLKATIEDRAPPPRIQAQLFMFLPIKGL